MNFGDQSEYTVAINEYNGVSYAKNKQMRLIF